MKIRIYGAGQPDLLLAGIEFITHANAVNGLVVHGPNRSGEEDICIQAKPGQVFVRRGYLGGHLACYEAGHEVVEDGAEVVWDSRPAEVEADCPNCGKTVFAAAEKGE